MPASFRVVSTFALEGRRLFVLKGRIIRGTVAPGMILAVPFNPRFQMTAPIIGIEGVVGDPDAPTCLTISYSSDTELALWRGLNIGDEVLEITENPERSPAAPAV